MRESNIQLLWKKYPPDRTENHELKLVNLQKKRSFAFNSVAEHQIEALQQAENGVLYHKIADMSSMGGFAAPKPFDCTFWVKVPGFIVIVFYLSRKRKTAYKIPIRTFIILRNIWDRKSISEDELRSISGPEIEIIELS